MLSQFVGTLYYTDTRQHSSKCSSNIVPFKFTFVIHILNLWKGFSLFISFYLLHRMMDECVRPVVSPISSHSRAPPTRWCCWWNSPTSMRCDWHMFPLAPHFHMRGLWAAPAGRELHVSPLWRAVKSMVACCCVCTLKIACLFGDEVVVPFQGLLVGLVQDVWDIFRLWQVTSGQRNAIIPHKQLQQLHHELQTS